MPRALRPWTRLLPIMPAAPVTTILIASPWRANRGSLSCERIVAFSCEQLLVGDACRSELADDDAAGAVGDRHRLPKAEARGEQCRQRGDDRVAGAGDVEDLARLGRDA